jgi:hypothetical protein
MVYQAWANTVQGEGVDLARTLGQLGQVSAELSSQTIPDRMGDEGKAQLLLGYLARFDNKE